MVEIALENAPLIKNTKYSDLIKSYLLYKFIRLNLYFKISYMINYIIGFQTRPKLTSKPQNST